MLDVGPPTLVVLPPPPTFLRPVIFSAAGRRGVSSGPNRASIHSLTCVREAEAAQSNGRCACKRALSHEALLVVTAQEGLLIILTQGRMCAFKQKSGVVAGKDRDRSFLMSSFVRTYVFTVNSVWNALVSMVGRGKKVIVDQNALFLEAQIASVLTLASHPQLASHCMINVSGK